MIAMQDFKGFLRGATVLMATMLLSQIAMADDVGANPHEHMAILAIRGTYMFSTGNIDDPKLLFTPNYVRHEQKYVTPDAKLGDISKLIESQREIYKVKDIQTRPEDVIVDVQDKRAAVRWSAAINRLPSADVKDAPEHLKVTGVTISRFENGKIAEQWVYYDSNFVLTLIRLNMKRAVKEGASGNTE